MDPDKAARNVADTVQDVVRGAVEDAAAVINGHSSSPQRSPGRPGPATPSLTEPTEPQPPLPPAPDQRGVAPHSPTGVSSGIPEEQVQQGKFLTTAQGARLRDTDHSLKAGRRGPTLLQDHHLREKITHFDHERIPERVVHARGAGAHGWFEGYGTAESITHAEFLGKGVTTPVFVRFSTVLGSRGSADTVRDTRGFATKFYTERGTFDLVANNIPVFFIQDGIKFPDVIHAGKPHPDREIPQAQSAHDTFWDFVSLHTEAQHHTIWNMSDRGIPRSYRMMEGFGVHTFRTVTASGETSLVKFHWKPVLGVHSLTWEEAQAAAGADPDFHRRDLYDAIEMGAFPEWELGVQVFPDNEEQMFEGIDLLDPTKLVPEEVVGVHRIGRLTLDANPQNFFAETEQVAFHPGHLPPGIEVTDDPLLQARLFSYLDTQLTRLGGPNFGQIPINRPHAPVNDMFRDGFHQQADHSGVAPYKPNSLDGGCPFMAGADDGAFADLPVELPAARKERAQPASFDDHFSQARLFWTSLTPVEQEHVIGAYSFELGKCWEPVIRERQLQCLARIDARLCAEVATALGMPAPQVDLSADLSADPGAGPAADVQPSPALSQLRGTWPVDGRVVALVVDEQGGADVLAELSDWRELLQTEGLVPLVVAATGGEVAGVRVDRTFATARSVEFDAVILLGSPAPAADAWASRDARAGAKGASVLDPRIELLVAEAWRHAKAIGAWGAGADALAIAGISADAPGIVVDVESDTVLDQVRALLGAHRVWERFPTEV